MTLKPGKEPNKDRSDQQIEAEPPYIPFNRPYTGDLEAKAAERVLADGVIRGDGPVSQRVEDAMEEWLGVEHVFLTTSCTHALEMAMIALGIGSGDEVIMPSFNFVSAANAVVLRGARPVFAEIRPDTLNVDPEDIVRRITPSTKAIIPVHYGGVSCDMDAIMEIAREHDLHVVEDAAQGIDAHYKDHPLGTIGDIGCYSFHETKNITCGEGGAFLTNDDEIARKAELVREKGTNRSAFARGEVDKYTWVSEGSSYILSDILAGVLEEQLERREQIKSMRREVWETYYRVLEPLGEAGKVTLPSVPDACDSNYHIFFFRVETKQLRDGLLDALKSEGIHATFHYIPLHTSPFGQKYVDDLSALSRTKRYSETLIRLPMYPQLAETIDSIGRRAASVLEAEINDIVGEDN